MLGYKKIKKISIIVLFSFLFSIFNPLISLANQNESNNITSGLWKIKTNKGEFVTSANGSYETWADGKQRFVLRDVLGHLITFGEAQIEKLTDGKVKVSVNGNEGKIEALKVTTNIDTNVSKAPSSNSSDATVSSNITSTPKVSLSQKLSELKEKITTPIEGGGRNSNAWNKGYEFAKEAPEKIVGKVKSLVSNNNQTSQNKSFEDVKNTISKIEIKDNNIKANTEIAKSVNVPKAEIPKSETVKTATLSEKLALLKEKAFTPIEGGGRNSEAWNKGYEFTKEAPEKVVSKVKGLFKSGQQNVQKEIDTNNIKQNEKTISQQLSDHKNAKVQFDEKTGAFERVPVSTQPSKLAIAFEKGGESLKSSFSIRNLGLSAATTVGFKIFEQVKNGEPISIGKAVGHLATGDFLGSFVGSGLGSAAGTVVGSLISTSIPGIGPIVGAFMPALFSQYCGKIGASLGNDLATGQKPSFKKAIASIDKVAVLGQAIGSTIGAALGSILLPGIGSTIGGLVGGMLANVIVNKIRGRAQNNYHISSVNVNEHQVIFSEQVAPPPAQNVINAQFSISSPGNTQAIYEKMINAYKRYSQLLSEGRGESSECQQALSEYKQLYTMYAESIKTNTNK